MGISRQRFDQIRHRDRKLARDAVQRQVRRGLIPPARDLYCVDCWEPAAEYDHHLGYGKEYRLAVVPRCIACHAQQQRQFDMRACAWCSRLFLPAGGGDRFCSSDCFQARNTDRRRKQKAWTTCDGCGRDVLRSKKQLGKFGRAWCSRECLNRTKQKRRNQIARWNPEGFKSRRKSLGFSQQDLAKCLGVSQPFVAHWECGIDPPHERHHAALIALGFDAEDITLDMTAEDGAA